MWVYSPGMDRLEYIGKTLQERDWYRKTIRRQSQWRKHAAMTATVCVVIVVSTAALLYRQWQQMPEPDHFPAKSVEELLDAIRPQIVEPQAEK